MIQRIVKDVPDPPEVTDEARAEIRAEASEWGALLRQKAREMETPFPIERLMRPLELPAGSDPDADLQRMTPIELAAEVMKLRAGIRRHRDASGHKLCWYSPDLWGLLPERIEPQPAVPPREEFLTRCARYRASLDD